MSTVSKIVNGISIHAIGADLSALGIFFFPFFLLRTNSLNYVIYLAMSDISEPEIKCQCQISRDMTKTNKMSVRSTKTQISLGIRPVWSESSLFA